MRNVELNSQVYLMLYSIEFLYRNHLSIEIRLEF